MARTIFRVLPNNGMWVVTQDKVRISEHLTKQPAIDEARRRANFIESSGGLAQVVVHRADGTIETEWTYGKDPFPPRG